MAFASTLFVSCYDQNLETSSSIGSGIINNNGTIYKISELPVIPNFAKPIEKAGEIREFTLIKNDGIKLNFELKALKQTLFGKMRTLVGTVSIDQEGRTKKEKAVLVVSENGFELLYTYHDQNFRLKSNTELNIGYKKPDLNTNKEIKKSFLEYARKKGIDGNEILNNLNKKNIDNDTRYDVVIEKSNHYNLINNTATTRRKEIAEGKGKCPVAQLPSYIPRQLSSKSVEADPSNYNIEIIYKEDTYDFLEAYSGLILSLYSVDNDIQNLAHVPNIYQYQMPDPMTNINMYVEYILAIFKKNNSNVQLDQLREYLDKYPSQKNVARCALYENGWDDSVLGMAWVGTYSSSSYSTLIACDDTSNVLAHECGHNLGANHVDNSNDVMYKYASSKLPHLDATNIANIKAKL